jgi:hypothetical protein
MQGWRCLFLRLSAGMLQGENSWMDFNDIWYERNATGGHSTVRNISFPAIGNNNVADARTCEVGAPLLPLLKFGNHRKHSNYSISSNDNDNSNHSNDNNQSNWSNGFSSFKERGTCTPGRMFWTAYTLHRRVDNFVGCTIAQTIRRRFLTVKPLVRPCVTSFEIRDGQSSTKETCLLVSPVFSLLMFILTLTHAH